MKRSGSQRAVGRGAPRRGASSPGALYVGLMSGTSLDGVDAVLVDLSARKARVLAHARSVFEPELRVALLGLVTPGADELDRAATLGNQLAHRYARVVHELLGGDCGGHRVRAIGCHGQTIRHRPDRGYSIQAGNPALLAELTGIPVVADFRSRDIAAGGQGAPLVPAFHAAAFANRREDRVVINIGGIANLSWLPRSGRVTGFDSGPGNCLLDLWCARHLGTPMDTDGAWATSGTVDVPLLARLLAEPYFSAAPPKSTGRELFGDAWLAQHLPPCMDPRTVQATLLELTARSVVDACRRFCGTPASVLVCGGGALNGALMRRLSTLFSPSGVDSTSAAGIDPTLVEAVAFAWLARQSIENAPASLPAVTGARGARILGARYPA